MTVARLRRLESKATPGPWYHGQGFEHKIPGDFIFYNDGVGPVVICDEQAPNQADALLLVAARNALVPLLDEIDAADAIIRKLEQRAVDAEVNVARLYEAKLADARRAALEEAAGWLEERAGELDAHKNGLAQVAADALISGADMLRERAKAVR